MKNAESVITFLACECKIIRPHHSKGHSAKGQGIEEYRRQMGICPMHFLVVIHHYTSTHPQLPYPRRRLHRHLVCVYEHKFSKEESNEYGSCGREKRQLSYVSLVTIELTGIAAMGKLEQLVLALIISAGVPNARNRKLFVPHTRSKAKDGES